MSQISLTLTWKFGNTKKQFQQAKSNIKNDSEKKKVVQRNPHVYEGTYINVNRKKDGTLYPTFNRRPQFKKFFTFEEFCRGAANELLCICSKSDNR